MTTQTSAQHSAGRWVPCSLIATAAIIAVVVLVALGLDSPGPAARHYPYWEATLQLDFRPGFWLEGPHEYTLTVDCPGSTHDLAATISFTVSPTSPHRTGRVFLRTDGLHSVKRRPATVDLLHPDQPSSALVVLELPTLEEAEECEAFITWDGFPKKPLNTRHIFKYADPSEFINW